MSNKNKNIIDFLKSKFTSKAQVDISIRSALTHKEDVIKNWVMYRSQPYELIQLFGKLEDVYPNSFWSNAGNVDEVVPRTISMPKQMVERMGSLCINSISDIQISDKEYHEVFQKIMEETNFYEEVLTPAFIAAEVSGDCLVVTLTDGVSPYPYHQVYSGENFNPIFENGRFKGADVYTLYIKKDEQNNIKNYLLTSMYRFGEVSFKLSNEQGQDISLDAIPETAHLQNFYIDKRFCYCSLLKFKKSMIFENRGESLYTGRETAFDALDEVYSLWCSTPTINSSKVFEDVKMLEKDRFGRIIKRRRLMNLFRRDDSQQYSNDNFKKQFEVYNPTWSVENFVQTHYENIQECLKDYISPSTMNINTQHFATQTNASYNSQIEKVTIETRKTRLEKLSPFIVSIVKNTIASYCQQLGKTMREFDVLVDFDEFETPSVEEKTEVFTKQIAAGLTSRLQAIKSINSDLDEEQCKEILEQYFLEQERLIGNNSNKIEEDELDKEEQEKAIEEE